MLVDTNVVSYIFKKHTLDEIYSQELEGHRLYVSFMTVAELYRWPHERNWGPALKYGLDLTISSYTVLPTDDVLLRVWAKLISVTRKSQPMGYADSWIAATALRHNLPLVTHNRKHFEGIPGLRVLSAAG